MPGKGVLYNGRGTGGKPRWAGATSGGDATEAKERGRKMDLCEVWIYNGASVRRDEVGWQKAIDELAWLDESAGRVSVDVPGAQREEDCQESARWYSQFAWEV